MANRAASARRAPDTYLNLVRAFPLAPIRTEAENNEAIEIVAALAERAKRHELDPAERDYLDVLVGLVERFEAEHSPLPPVTGPAMVRCLMDQQGFTQSETAKQTGISESTLSEVLAGKRKMSAKHIRSLAKFFGVSPDVVIGDCE